MSRNERRAPLAELGGKSVLFVMAATQEYGPHLQERFTPLMCGVGPVESALSTGVELAAHVSAGTKPDLLVSLGSAGSRVLQQVEVYQVTSVAYRDMDVSALGFEKGVTPFLDLPAVLDLGPLIPGLPSASLSTGANVVSGAGYDGIDADMVDMETFAIKRVCQQFGVPLIGFRGISDGVEELQHFDDWTEYLHLIDEKLADAVDQLSDALSDGLLD